jgi:hypothetical protein
MEPLPPAIKSHKQSYDLPEPVDTIAPVQSFTELNSSELNELKKMILPFTLALSPNYINNPGFIGFVEHQPEMTKFLIEQANIKRKLRRKEDRQRRENFVRSFASLFANVGKPLELAFTTVEEEGIQRHPLVSLEIKEAGKELHATVHRPSKAGNTEETYVLVAVAPSHLEFGNHIYKHRTEQATLKISKPAWKATHPLPAHHTLVGLAARCLAKNWTQFKPASQIVILQQLGISKGLTVRQAKVFQDEEMRILKAEQKEVRRGSPKGEKKEKTQSIALDNQGKKRKRGEEEEEEAVASEDDDMSDFQDARELGDNVRLVKRCLFVDLVSEEEEEEEDEKAGKRD